jgi:transcriptional regulator with XRE-family HTH domain
MSFPPPDPSGSSMPARRQLAKDPNLDAFSENLAQIRKERGMSQLELAAKIGIAQPNISDYERGNVRPSLDIFVALLRTLNASADQLLGLETAPPQPVLKDKKLLQHVALIEKLPRRDREALLRTIRLYVDKI